MRQPSGETALALRIEKAAQNLGWQCIHTDVNGYVLNESYENSGTHINDIKNLEFVIHPHFASKKVFDTWSIFPIWNPPEIPYDWPNPIENIVNYIHHDDYVSSNPFGNSAVDHLNSILSPNHRHFDNKIQLYPALPRTVSLPPSRSAIVDASQIFYVGMNWERHFSPNGRHEGVFRRLDADGCIAIYGPHIASGVVSWEGFKGYKGDIPFDDGTAAVKLINSYGISLAISSLKHRRSEIMTNRLYESAASGVVIIADKCKFVNDMFGDSVFQVENTDDQDYTYRQIKSIFEFIKKNPDVAYEKACRAQEIYLEKFTLEVNLERMFSEIPKRQVALKNLSCAQSAIEPISVVLRWYVNDFEALDLAIKSINKQSYKNIELIVVCDKNVKKDLEEIFRKKTRDDIQVAFCPLDILSMHNSDLRLMRTGELLSQAMSLIKTDFVAFLDPLEEWFEDHLSSLKRGLEDNKGADFAYVPVLKCVWKPQAAMVDMFVREFFSPEQISKMFYELRYDNRIGRILFRTKYLNDLLTDNLRPIINLIDQLEFFVFAPIALSEGKATLLQRTTYVLHNFTVPPRTRKNWWSLSSVKSHAQRSIINSYLIGRSDIFLQENLMRESVIQGAPQLNNEAQLPSVDYFLSASNEAEFIQRMFKVMLSRMPTDQEMSECHQKLYKGQSREKIAVAFFRDNEVQRKSPIISGMYELNRRSYHNHMRRFMKKIKLISTVINKKMGK